MTLKLQKHPLQTLKSVRTISEYSTRIILQSRMEETGGIFSNLPFHVLSFQMIWFPTQVSHKLFDFLHFSFGIEGLCLVNGCLGTPFEEQFSISANIWIDSPQGKKIYIYISTVKKPPTNPKTNVDSWTKVWNFNELYGLRSHPKNSK